MPFLYWMQVFASEQNIKI